MQRGFEFYRSVFGGEFAILETFRNGPPDMSIPEDEMDNIMHVSFPIGDSVLMGSDTPSIFEGSHVVGTNISISVSPESKDEANRLFGSLSEGGSVAMPMADMFWGLLDVQLHDSSASTGRLTTSKRPRHHGREGSFHALRCREYGANLVAGVTPGRGGQIFDGDVPVFNTVRQAVDETQAKLRSHIRAAALRRGRNRRVG
ncbi:Succinate--CoA ligase [ADP-forming] subunit alpha [Geodia barretti]|uniref:Succinate--CoA ligase [ADP-forming] subunit alpha n=1 Tax=Geodia barretti TaxID=519541 RepID=A0AA35S0K1_GEOBA|nr:Succinate--CoA ligase [ADP-forming] subunit alpha [Geodia barretti]